MNAKQIALKDMKESNISTLLLMDENEVIKDKFFESLVETSSSNNHHKHQKSKS